MVGLQTIPKWLGENTGHNFSATSGETYAFSPNITETEAQQAWIKKPAVTFVATNEQGTILGSYYIKPNQPGLGSHVCNCGYIIASEARGQGIASKMCQHSQEEAVRLWQRHGFEIIGTLPQAFQHSKLGYVNAFVMYKQLVMED